MLFCKPVTDSVTACNRSREKYIWDTISLRYYNLAIFVTAVTAVTAFFHTYTLRARKIFSRVHFGLFSSIFTLLLVSLHIHKNFYFYMGGVLLKIGGYSVT